MFSCEFCKISKYTFFTEHLRTTASVRKPTFELQIFHVITTFFTIFRGSHRRCSIKKGVLENFANFIGKDLCKVLFFSKVSGLTPTLLKGEFPVNFAKFLRTPFWQNTSRNCFGIFQNIHIKNNFRSSRPEVFCKKGVPRNFTKFTGKPLCFRPAILLEKRLRYRGFPVNFVKFLRTPFF